MKCERCGSTSLDHVEFLPCSHAVWEENGITYIRVTDGDVDWDCGDYDAIVCRDCGYNMDPPEESDTVVYF